MVRTIANRITDVHRNQNTRIKLKQLQKTGFIVGRLADDLNIDRAEISRFMSGQKGFSDELLADIEQYIKDLQETISNI